MTDGWFAEVIACLPERARLKVAGAAINLLHWGLDTPDRPTLLFVHGMMANAQWWAPIAPFFRHSHRVLAIDLSGMGDSDHRPHYDRPTHAAEIAAVARELGTNDLTVVAHSFGGVPASEALLEDPALARRLVLIDSPVLQRGAPRSDPDARSRRPYPTREAALARFRLVPPGAHPLAPYVRFIAEHSLREIEGGWDWKFDWRLRQSYASADPVRPAALTLPAWIVYGDRSEVQSPAEAEALAAAFDTPAKVVSIPSAHHHVMVEQPIALVAVLRAILAD